MNGIFHQPQSIRRWTLGIYWSLMFAATHWPEIDRWAPKGWDVPFSDKLIHALMYGGWMTLWWWVLASKQPLSIPGRTVAWLIIGGALYGIFDETTQALVERHPSVADWTCDVLGLVCAAIILRFRPSQRPLHSI